MLERWITPSLFKSLLARDEYGFCEELGDRAADKLERHWRTFMREEDFTWLAEQGINAVRIPVGYWLFGDNPPFIGSAHILDTAFEMAAAHGIGVVIDLHGLPGSQNGNDHSGRAGKVEWHTDPTNIDKSLEIVERIAETYGKQSNLLGIEVANEPKDIIPHNTLVYYYEQAYARIRRHCRQEVAAIISDAFRFYDWQNDLLSPEYTNLWLDTHLYQAFGRENERRNIQSHLLQVKRLWPEQIDKVQQAHPLLIGEWSLGLPAKAFRGMDEPERDLAMKAFAALQLEAFQNTKGWFFWTYKTEDMDGWSFRTAIQRGWLSMSKTYLDI